MSLLVPVISGALPGGRRRGRFPGAAGVVAEPGGGPPWLAVFGLLVVVLAAGLGTLGAVFSGFSFI